MISERDSTPRATRFEPGDPQYVQAQRIWLILTAHVMMEWHWRGESRHSRRQRDVLIPYGDLAARMGMDRRAGRTLAGALGIIGQYCRLNNLPTLNSIVVNQETWVPGDHVVVRTGKSYQDEQREIMEEDWFALRVPTTGAFRKVRDYIRAGELGDTEIPRSSTREILKGTEEILREEGGPMLSGEILRRLNDRGIHVGGRNPSTNLSSKISQARDRFISNGRRKGWRLPSNSDAEVDQKSGSEHSPNPNELTQLEKS